MSLAIGLLLLIAAFTVAFWMVIDNSHIADDQVKASKECMALLKEFNGGEYE